METDYNSPPRPHSKLHKNKKQYGKKARRMTAGTQGTEKAGNSLNERKESSESEELVNIGRSRRETGVRKEVKRKGKEAEGREGRKGNRKEENSQENKGVAVNNGKSRVRESISSQRQISSRSRKSQPILLASKPSSSTLTRRTSNSRGIVTNIQPHASTSRLPSETDLALPLYNAQSSASDLGPAPPVKKKCLSKLSLGPENLIENTNLQPSRTSSIESLTNKFDKTFPPTSIQAFRASIVSPQLSAFSDKSNFPPSTSATNARTSHSQSTTNSPRLTDFPPTLPRLTRSHSTRLSLSQPPKTTSSSKLSVFQDEPIASTSTSTSRPAPSLSPHSKRLSLSQFPSLSPSFASSNTSKPTFRFTTTSFPDAPPSPTFALGLVESEFGIGGGGKEAEGAGMESTFLLESWDANATALSQDPVEDEEKEKGSEEDKVIEGGGKEMEDEVEMEVDKGGVEFADETNSTIRGGADQESSVEVTVQQEETGKARVEEEAVVEAEGLEEAAKEEIEVPEILELPRVEDTDAGEFEEEEQDPAYEAEDSGGSSQQEDPIKSSDSDRSSSSPSLRPIYTASFLPPRRPRSPSHALKHSPLPTSSPPKIPSDEDDLAYLIRTTATHSSEDDLPPLSSDLSSDERSLRLAEREVGWGLKASSNQRGKRVKLREKLRERVERGCLKIGEGKEGRRLGWKREIIDLTGENDEEEEGEDELALPSTRRGRSGVKKEEEEMA